MRYARAAAQLFFATSILCLFFCEAATSAAQNSAPAPTGAEVYQKRCASCHDQAGSRAPSRDALQKLSVTRIMRTLDFGLMMAVAYPINRADREAVANFLGTKTEESPLPASAFCSANVS